MSILIRDMEMPTKQVLAVINPDGLVEILNSDNILIEEFQAIPVPDHGRLGDLDKLFKRMFIGPDGQRYPDKDVDGWDHTYTFREIKQEILSAPTIIPADKEE